MIPLSENKQKMLRGDLYHAFTPELIRERQRCRDACQRLIDARETSRRRQVELWRDINGDISPMPSQLSDPEQDAALFDDEPWVEAPIHIDYGTNVRLGSNVYISHNCTILDTCLVSIGSRTLVAPNVSFYSATHPIDPQLRNGMRGPETGMEIHVGEDCWIGGGAIILPGVTVGRGSTVGAGSVVTRDVPPFHVVAGNPARIIREIKTTMSMELPTSNSIQK